MAAVDGQGGPYHDLVVLSGRLMVSAGATTRNSVHKRFSKIFQVTSVAKMSVDVEMKEEKEMSRQRWE
jgi:hypothetical protein